MENSGYSTGRTGELQPRSIRAPHPRPDDTTRYRGEELAAELLELVFKHVNLQVPVRLWRGADFTVGHMARPDDAAPAVKDPPPVFTFVFKSPESVYRMVLGRDPLRLAEAYFDGDVDIEGDLFAALALKDHLQSLRMPLRDRVGAVLKALRLRAINRNAAVLEGVEQPVELRARSATVRAHSKAENRDAVHFHYDVSNEFYGLWLDRAMVYSCGYFERTDVDLDDAQQAKLEHICRKLMLKPADNLLDIGCGWGALIIYAAQHYGVRAHGITLSERQLRVARRRIAETGLQDRVTVELKDYRDLVGECVYDKVSSVGMFEHVGLANLPVYFSTVHRLMKPAGLLLNHGITHEQAGWTTNISTEFINRYVFPDAQLDNISNIQGRMEDAQFEIADVESLRAHYALTLRHWVRRLEAHRTRALEYVDESAYRIWRLYMTACALEFERAHLGIYQILASKRGRGTAALPLTRRHLYGDSAT